MTALSTPFSIRRLRSAARAGRSPLAGCRQRGAFAVMSIPLILVLLSFCGLAVDMGMLYNRKVDLSGFTKAVALAAAHELNGTAAGVAAARARAKETAGALHYQYFQGGSTYVWNDAALTFGSSSSRSDPWSDGSVPAGLYFAKVDTSGLAQSLGTVKTIFMGIVVPSLHAIQLNDSAIAGRSAVNVTPIAVCAMDDNPATERVNAGASASELVEYGFRRGVSYDLMQLNPNGTTPVRYVVNPVIAPGVTSAVFDTSLIGAFVCTGNMWIPRLSGGALRVSSLPSAAPLAALFTQLNSRFDDFSGGLCNANGAPPDYNVKPYAYGAAAGLPWMNPVTGNAAAAVTTSRGRLETIADLPAPPGGTPATAYGPLWSFARAVKYASYVPGQPESASGYDTFGPDDWPTLYSAGPNAAGYQAAPWTPYQATAGANYKAPSAANLEVSTLQRRVLNLPLLSCPAGTGSNMPATAKAIGKFFMTVPATADSLVAEFAGILPEQALTGEVELFP